MARRAQRSEVFEGARAAALLDRYVMVLQQHAKHTEA